MNITEHSLKRIALLTMDNYAHKEVLFLHQFILPGLVIIPWDHGLNIDDIPRFVERCHRFGGRVLGLENWLYSPYKLYTFSYEDYSSIYIEDWYRKAIVEFKRVQVFDMIIPTISIPATVLGQYID